MRIACPTCSAAYDVAPERVPPGRGVRCAKCGVVWTPVATVDAEPALAVVEPVVAAPVVVARAVEGARPVVAEPVVVPAVETGVASPLPGRGLPEPGGVPFRAAMVRPAVAGPAPARGGALLILCWIVSFAVLGGAGWLAFAHQERVVAAWPESRRAYVWLGVGR